MEIDPSPFGSEGIPVGCGIDYGSNNRSNGFPAARILAI
jgi:hypothetical protein